MNKLFKGILCVILTISMLPAVSFAAEEAEIYANESFNSYPSYDEPSDWDLNSRFYWIEPYAEGEKGLLLTGDRAVHKLNFTFTSAGNTAVSFDIMSIGKGGSGKLTVSDSSGTSVNLLEFSKDNRIRTYNGKYIYASTMDKMTNICLVYKSSQKAYDVYVNNRRKVNNYKIVGDTVPIAQIDELSFNFVTAADNAVILDNINIFEGSGPMKSYYEDEYNEEACDVKKIEDIIVEPEVGAGVMLNEDFESGSTAMQNTNCGNILEVVEESDGNHALLMEKTIHSEDVKDFHANASGLTTSSDFAVYEFDIKVDAASSLINVNAFDESDNLFTIAGLTSGRVMHFGDKTKTLAKNKWYRFSFVFNYFDRIVEYYMDGKKVTEAPIPDDFANGETIMAMRWHATIYSLVGMSGTVNDDTKLWLDNIKVYDSKVPLEDLGDVVKVIKPSKKSPFPKDTAYINMLEGYMAFHNRSGILYADGKKHLLTDDIKTENGVTVVNTAKFCDSLGIAVPQSAVEYMQAEQIFTDIMGKRVTKVNSEINSGLIVAGGSAFTPPKDAAELQKLNDYVFYLRPSEEEVVELYEASPNYGKHPRIQADAEDFARIREEVKTDVYMSDWADSIINEANSMIDAPVVKYELRDGIRLLQVSREVVNKMYVLGMAYQLSGDAKYPERAYKELEAVCSFASWHPGHALDTGEMAAGVALGYDWMYDAFTPEQRALIENGIYSNCFYDYYFLYTEPKKGLMYELGIQDGNWVCPISGGATMAALAVMDVYPDIAPFILKSAIRAMDGMTFRYAPDGAWYEGPSYWEYVMQYSSKMFTTLKSALGTDLGFSKCEGLSRAGRYILEMQGDLGIFNYGDGNEIKIYCPEMFWMSNEYNDPLIAQALLNITDGKMADGEDRALALIFYETDNTRSDEVFGFDAKYDADGVVTMRDSWDGDNTTFAGIQFGDNRVGHAHLDTGSFVFDSMGIRWAKDIGATNYSSAGYFDESDHGDKWNFLSTRAEAHNTIVINPKADQDQEFNSYAPVTRFESKPRGAIAVGDMTEAYRGDASSAVRGAYFTDNRRSLVIRDEIKLKSESELYWFMITIADVEIDGDTLILTQGGRRLKFEVVSDTAHEISCDVIKPLVPEVISAADVDYKNLTQKRIQIRFPNASGEVNITVKLSPYDEITTPVSDYDMPIASWTIPDGEIPPKPYVDNIIVGTDTFAGINNNIDYFYVSGTLTEVPDVNAYSDVYDIEIEKAVSLSDITKIYVRDRDDSNNVSVYSVVFREIPKPIEFEGKGSIPVIGVIPSSEPQPVNIAANVLDGDMNTRWSASGVGQYIILDTQKVQEMSGISLAFWGDEGRKYKLVISVSDDGIGFRDVWSGMSSGAMEQYEFFDFAKTNARYVKVTSNGNSQSSEWTSITEAIVYNGVTQ